MNNSGFRFPECFLQGKPTHSFLGVPTTVPCRYSMVFSSANSLKDGPFLLHVCARSGVPFIFHDPWDVLLRRAHCDGEFDNVGSRLEILCRWGGMLRQSENVQ